MGCRSKLLITHDPIEDFVIPLHSLNEKVVKDAGKAAGEVRQIICLRRFNDLFKI